LTPSTFPINRLFSIEDGSMLSQTEIAYIAGLFDGEGSISILRNEYNRVARRGFPRYDLCISICNQHHGVLKEVQAEFGGSLGSNGSSYYWRASSLKAKIFLEAVQPYLKIKKPQLEIVLLFQELKSQHGTSKMTEDELIIYQSFQDTIKALNKQNSLAFHEKSGELLGPPLENLQPEDNQQPSSSNEIKKVDEKVHRLTGEENSTNNPDTSARPERDDIVGTA
jgi:hypothetical protein